MKGSALGLALKQRRNATQKSPIGLCDVLFACVFQLKVLSLTLYFPTNLVTNWLSFL